jgi:hypothetical protein
MRYFFMLLGAGAALLCLIEIHSRIGFPLSAGSRVDLPNPEISLEDANKDRPSKEDFQKAGYREISQGEAYALGDTSNDTFCNKSWKQAVQNMGPEDKAVLSGPLQGLAGICTWYTLRIVEKDGTIRTEFGRPGPRNKGQQKGVPTHKVGGDRILRRGVTIPPSIPPSISNPSKPPE